MAELKLVPPEPAGYPPGVTVGPLPPELTAPIWLDTDLLARDAETQIRAKTDYQLVAEYAQAMLDGANFPPVTVYHSIHDGIYYIGDGFHRVDATALAHAKNPQRKNEVLAHVHGGGFEDALRCAMQANGTHGKRLERADFQRAIEMALKYDLLGIQRANEVVPALMDLIPGLSARWAWECTADYRARLLAERNRRIAQLQAEGRSQRDIADQLGIDHKTVANVLVELGKNCGAAETPQPVADPPELPDEEKPPVPDVEDEDAEVVEVEEEDDPGLAVRFDFSPLLPLLPGEPPETVDDSGLILPEEPPAEADPEALAALDMIDITLGELFAGLSDLSGLKGHFTAEEAQPVQFRLIRAAAYLTEISSYLTKRGVQ